MREPCEMELKRLLVLAERFMDDERERLNKKYGKSWSVKTNLDDTRGYLFAEKVQEELWTWIGTKET